MHLGQAAITLPLSLLLALHFMAIGTAQVVREVTTPMVPPTWALLQRQLLKANTDACVAFFEKYFDERGYLECVTRWGGDDGPDDAIENCSEWPLLYALGADGEMLEIYRTAWEGHLRQFTEARTTDVPFARDGMYYKEFPVMMDWLHNGEGITPFNHSGLCDPYHRPFQQRIRRFAGFYMNEDRGAPNYDPEHKIIRSLFNGSRGPLLRRATALDWAGDPIEVEGRFRPLHGEENYEQMLAHFEEYNDIVGDHPSNLLATSLALNAYMLDHETKYRDWILEYCDAWLARMEANNGIIPTNIGLDGTIGGATEGKWWGGVYGWGFTVTVPQTGEKTDRSTFQSGFRGFMNAFLLSGDMRYLVAWRTMLDQVNANTKEIDGEVHYPRKYGDNGWYSYAPSPYAPYADDLYFLTLDERDLKWAGRSGWIDYLHGNNDAFPEEILRRDLERVRTQVARMREDRTTPDTRLSDDPMPFIPATVTGLLQTMLGGINPGHLGNPLFCSLRYFDPEERRPGIPPDVAALVHSISHESVEVTLVNLDQVTPRRVVVQGGAFGEHRLHGIGDNASPSGMTAYVTLVLAPGAGQRLTIPWQRFARQPSLRFPWDRPND